MAGGEGVEGLAHELHGLGLGLVALGLDARGLLFHEGLQLRGGEGGLAQNLGHQAQGGRHVLPGDLDHGQGRGGRAVHHDLGLQLVEGIRELLPGVLGGAPHEHGARQARDGLAVHQLGLAAEAQGELQGGHGSFRLPGEQGGLQSVRGGEAHRAGLHVLGAGIEGFALGDHLLALVVLHQGCDVLGGGELRAIRLLGGDVLGQGAIAGLEGGFGRGLHLIGLGRQGPVPLEEQVAPVASGHAFAEDDGQGLGVGEELVDGLAELGLGPLQLGGREWVRLQGLKLLEEHLLRLLRVAVLGQDHAEYLQARLGGAFRGLEDLGRQLGLHQGLVEAAGGARGEDVGGQIHVAARRMESWGNVVAHHEQGRAAHPADRDAALAILDGLARIGGFEGALGVLQRAEGLVDAGQRFAFIELPGHHQDGVVRRVVAVVEGAEVLHIHLLDVRAGADGRLAVVVPVEGHGLEPLDGHAEGIVLAGLKFIAHHGHLAALAVLAPQRLRREVAVLHAIRFEVQGLAEVLLRGREGDVVVGAVEGGGAVEVPAQLVEQLGYVGVLGRALEDHVLQQVRHARLAIVLVAAAHQVGDVGGDGGLAGIGEEQHPQAVGEPVFGDAFHCRQLGWRGQGGCWGGFGLGGDLRDPGLRGLSCHQREGQGPTEGQPQSTEEGHGASRL